MSGALALQENQDSFDEKQIAALSQMGLRDVDAGNLSVFLHYCQTTKLDPFARQIYMIGRRDTQNNVTRYTIQTSIDGFRVIAKRSNKYRGQLPVEWCGPDGKWTDVWLAGANNPPSAAKVQVLHADYDEPITAVAVFDSYCPMTRNGERMGLWKTMPEQMIAKCAEALALRKAFPNDLSGIYTEDEMEQEDNAQRSEREVKPKVEKEVTEAEVMPTEEELELARQMIAVVTDYEDLEELKVWYYAKEPRFQDMQVDGTTLKQVVKDHVIALKAKADGKPTTQG